MIHFVRKRKEKAEGVFAAEYQGRSDGNHFRRSIHEFAAFIKAGFSCQSNASKAPTIP